MRAVLLVQGVSLFALMAPLADAAQAQAIADQVAPPATVPPATTPQALATTDTKAGTAEIIVTAMRRAQSVQSVPIAVSAYSGADLKNTRVTDFSSLTAKTPGPTFIPVSGASGSQIQVRGQVSTDDSPGFDTPVAVFIDDVYYGSVASFYPEFYDVEQIAVLRGPQGTTFGRNTVGGAIQVTSARPKFDDTSGSIAATIRNYSGFESQGNVNIPLGETVAARFAYSARDNGGYQHNLITGNKLNDRRVWSVRGSLRFQPTPELDILASVNYTRNNSLGDGPVLFGQGAVIAGLKARSTSYHDSFVNEDGFTRQRINANVLKVDYQAAIGTISSITAYRRLRSSYGEDIDGGPNPIVLNKVDTNRENQFSQELRLVSPTGEALEYIVGLYYLHLKAYRKENFGLIQPPNLLTGGRSQTVFDSGDNTTESIAGYAELKYNVSSKFAVIGGIRYTRDHKNSHIIQNPASAFFGVAKDVMADATFSAWTPRFVVEYKPARDVMLYANVSKGWKSGGFPYGASTIAQVSTPLKPEVSWSYEVGAKTTFLDRRVTLNFDVFQADTSNLQVRSLVGATLQFNNAGKARSKGFEMDLNVAPVDGLDLGGNYAYIDSYYASFPNCTAAGANCTGNQRPFTPKNTLNLYGQYKFDLTDQYSLQFRVESRWASKYQQLSALNDISSTRLTRQRNFANAFITLDRGDTWSLQFWGRNIFDKKAVTFATNYFFYHLSAAEFASGLRNADRTSVAPPRMYGATLTYRFGGS